MTKKKTTIVSKEVTKIKSNRPGFVTYLTKTLEAIDTSIDKRSDAMVWHYTPTIGKMICDAITEGMSITSISKLPGSPPRHVIYRWMDKNPDFKELCEAARPARGDYFADRVDEESKNINEDNAKSKRVELDALKWLAKVNNPSKYAEVSPAKNDGVAQPIQIIVHTGIQRSAPNAIEAVVIDKETDGETTDE